MTRAELEHVIRAAAAISRDNDIVVVGSQAVLGQYPNAPRELCVSMEADVYPRTHPERADLIDGSIGELSPFHTTFGYYAQGVGPETATLPAGWEQRLVRVSNANTQGATGWCLELHDLVLAKYVAGREKDHDYIRVAIAHGLLDRHELEGRAQTLAIDDVRRVQILARIGRDFAP